VESGFCACAFIIKAYAYTDFDTPLFNIHPSHTLYRPVSTMNATVRCHGCNNYFTQSGFSRHVAKTRDMRCRAVYGTSQAQPGFRPIPSGNVDHASSSLASILSTTPRTNTNGLATDRLVDSSNEDSLSPLHFPEIPGDEYAVELPLPAMLDPGWPPAQAEESGVVVINRFPFGSPGALFFGPHEISPTNALNASSPAAIDGPSWAPFRSECDWKVAHWAKMRGPSSSAMTELLAIPEVCRHCFHVIMWLMYRERSSRSWIFHFERQNN
jgi:hypothetical protein